MDKVQDEGFDILGDLLARCQNGMEHVPRWAKYVERGATPENDLQHTFTASLLTIIVIETLQEQAPDWAFDAYAVLSCVILHDLGEIAEGDTHYVDKTPEKDQRELAAFSCLLGQLQVTIRQRLEERYLLQYSEKCPEKEASESRELMVFECIERLGYLLYAYREYRDRGDLPLMLQVSRNQHGELLRLAGRVPAFGASFYPPSLGSQIEHLLSAYPGQHPE